MRFTWDARKNAANIRKHGIGFARAARIFSSPTLEAVDDASDYGEERIKAIGLVEDTEILVVYTDRPGGERRIISARKATREEREVFWRAIGSER